MPSAQYPLISPLLMCSFDQKDFNEDKNLETIVNDFISAHIRSKAASNISVYLIDYKTGRWTGVNENERYDPASMLKVPLMIAYYKEAEKNPSILKQQVAFNGDDQNSDEYFKASNVIQSGHFYTVEQLIESMIVHSDNTAAVLLDKNIEKSAQHEVYTDLGLPVPQNAPNEQFLSVKTYAYFFRILYNATYLNEEYSQRALDLLNKTEFPGIRAGVADTAVAHKFGERTVYDQNNVVQDRELHDCGIVYKKETPYLLCIMSRGNNFDTLAKNISDLSALIYKNI